MVFSGPCSYTGSHCTGYGNLLITCALTTKLQLSLYTAVSSSRTKIPHLSSMNFSLVGLGTVGLRGNTRGGGARNSR